MLFKRWKTTPGMNGTWHLPPAGARLHRRIASRLQVRLRLVRLRFAILFWLRQLRSVPRSLSGRIALLREKRKGLSAICHGPAYDPRFSDWRLSLESLASSACTEFADSRYPWASDADLLLLLEGVRLGTAFAHCISGTQGDRWREACANLSNREVILNEMSEAMHHLPCNTNLGTMTNPRGVS